MKQKDKGKKKRKMTRKKPAHQSHFPACVSKDIKSIKICMVPELCSADPPRSADYAQEQQTGYIEASDQSRPDARLSALMCVYTQ